MNEYPLQWPQGWPRTESSERKSANFGTKNTEGWGMKQLSIAQATKRIMDELSAYTRRGHPWRIDLDETVISTDLKVRRADGLPKSGQRNPDDPGVAVYFELDGKPQVIPCDKYTRIADNLAAVAATLSSLRALERHGTDILDRAFTGFTALEHNPEESWEQILQMGNRRGEIDSEWLASAERHYKMLAAEYHPDKPAGSNQMMSRINLARQKAREALRG